jgi:hypothetical protein
MSASTHSRIEFEEARDRRAGVERSEPGGRAGVPGMALRSEVRVLSWGPDRGNPTSRGKGVARNRPGGLLVAGLRGWASVRAGLKEAVGASWWRTKVKRRKAFLGRGELARGSDALFLPDDRGRIGDAITTKSQRLTPGGLLGAGEVGR